MCPEVRLEFRGNVDGGRLPRSILDHEEELRHDLDDVSGLEDKVPFPLDGLGGQTAGDVGLAPQLSGRGGLKHRGAKCHGFDSNLEKTVRLKKNMYKKYRS